MTSYVIRFLSQIAEHDIETLLCMSSEMEQDMKKKYSITDEDYRVLETTIIKMEPHKAGPQWKFIGAFYFATVVLVMIGEFTLHTEVKRNA